MTPPRRVVITGAPGAGKTTLLHELARLGYAVVPEVARQIIQEQVAQHRTALPWDDNAAYAAQVLQRSIRDFQSVSGEEGRPVFFDRGIPDALCHIRLSGMDEEAALTASITYAYYPTVFLARVWPEIYVQDAERRQTLDEARRVTGYIENIYKSLGYHVVELPRATPAVRAEFISNFFY